MWDCVPAARREEAIAHVASLGGLKAIAISHPHYYGAVADWSAAFGNAPVYLHGDDAQWVTRPYPSIVPWQGDSHRISDDILLVRAGGHFAGATVLHWRAGADGRGALLTGDIAHGGDGPPLGAASCTRYPNYIPLERRRGPRASRSRVAPLAFDRIYGAWWGKNIAAGGEGGVRRVGARAISRRSPTTADGSGFPFGVRR